VARDVSEFEWLGKIIGESFEGSTPTAPWPQGVAGRHPRPLAPLDAWLAARLLSGVAPPPADGFATGTPLRGGTLRSRLPVSRAPPVLPARPFGLVLDAPPVPRVPPRLRRGGGGGSAPHSGTGAGAPQIAGAICTWRRPPSPSATWLGPGAPQGAAQRLLLAPLPMATAPVTVWPVASDVLLEVDDLLLVGHGLPWLQ
jgi:hypothetical protein